MKIWVPGFVRRFFLKRAIRRLLDQIPKEVFQMEFLKAIFTSKKAAVVVAGILTVLLKNLANLDDATVQMIVELIIGYLFAQGGVDAVLAYKGYKTK